MRSRLPVCLGVVGCLIPAACSEPPQEERLSLVGVPPEEGSADRRLLGPGVSIGGRLGPAESRRFPVDLEAESFVQVLAHQEGVDLVLRLLDGEGKTLAERDSPTGTSGRERLSLVTEEGGRYLLEVEGYEGSEAEGNFRLQVSELRPALPEDHAFAEAEETSFEILVLDVVHRQSREAQRRILELAPRAARLWEDAGEPLEAAEVRFCAAMAADRLGLETRAESLLLLALPGFEGGGRTRRWGECLNHLAFSAQNRGDFDRAEQLFRQAVAVQRRQSEPWEQFYAAENLINLGALHEEIGEPHEALSWLMESEPILEALTDARDPDLAVEIDRLIQVLLNNLGTAHAALGDLRVASHFYERALAELPEEGEGAPWKRAATTINLGWTFHAAGDLESARAAHETALAQLRASEAGSPWVERTEVRVLLHLGGVALDSGDLRTAEDRIEEALAMALAQGDPVAEAFARQQLGRYLTRTGSPARAREHLLLALELAQSQGDALSELQTLHWLARLHRSEGDLQEALALSRRAVQGWEAARGRILRRDLRSTFGGRWQDYFFFQADLQIEAGDLQGAFETIESSRGQLLLELLMREGVGPDHDLPPAQAARRKALDRRLAAAHRRLRRALERSAPRPELLRLDGAVEEVLQELRSFEAELLNLTQDEPRPWSPQRVRSRAIQSRLGPGRALVELALGPEKSLLFWLTAEDLEVFELPPRQPLEAAATALHDALRLRLPEPALRRLRKELAGTLLAPLGTRLEAVEILFVVADGPFHYVPWELLLESRGAEAGSSTRVPRVAYLTAAGSFDHLSRRTPEARAPKVAVVAAPILAAGDLRLSPAARQRAGAGGELLPPLRFAEQEARAILELVPPELRVALTGPDASMTSLKGGALEEAGIVHFSTHAEIDNRRPELSALYLSQFAADGSRFETDRLTPRDVPHLGLDAWLVVLSACESALGEPRRGEGLLGFTQSFLQSGVQVLIASLWSVDDEATAALMSSLYTFLLVEGLEPVEALERAKEELRQSHRWQHPFFWGGFVLIGIDPPRDLGA